MNQSQPKKKAPVLKDVSKCQRALLTQGEKPIVAKETLSSEAKEHVRLAQKYKIRNVSRAQDKTCNRRIKNEKQEHISKTMQQKDENRKTAKEKT